VTCPPKGTSNPNLAGDCNPDENRRTAQGDGEQPTGIVIRGTTQANSPKEEANNTNLAAGDNPAQKPITSKGDSQREPVASTVGPPSPVTILEAKNPRWGSRQPGGPVLRLWQCQSAATLVMLSITWTSGMP